MSIPVFSKKSELHNLFPPDPLKKVSLVPTMGALHDGHLALVQRAKALSDRVLVSIFVNPLQFGPHEDLDRYPRTLASDIEQLETVGVDAVYAPTVMEMYPCGIPATRIGNPVMGSVLCGAHRPQHFDGVLTVVFKLYQQLRPDMMVFGEKDFQQFTLIKTMMRDLDVAVDVLAVPTQREVDGLALSSRNRYLSADQRIAAPFLYKTLKKTREKILLHPQAAQDLCAQAHQDLRVHGFNAVDYVQVLNAETLAPWSGPPSAGRLFVAARLGETRLIDNVAV